jgi:ankyrin repeat protein
VIAVVVSMSYTVMSTISKRSDSVTSVRETPSVTDLVRGDVPQLLAWMASEHISTAKLASVLLEAASVGRTDMCLAIIDSGRLPIDTLAQTLKVACYYNQHTLTNIIVGRYQSVLNFQHLYEALLEASSQGHIEVVQCLLGEMKLSHDESVTWLLATASARGDIDTIKLLIAQTASQAIHDTSHALRCACYNGRGDVVDWLMANTASSVSKVGDLGADSGGTMTSLTAACYNCHTDIMKTLLQCVTPHTVNIQCGRYNDSALSTVIWRSYNSRVNALHVACTNSNIDTVNTLLYTDDVNVQNNDGDTPMHCACQMGNVDIVGCLISVFADTNITDNDKTTPVEQAEFFGNNELISCFSQLLPRWADTTINATSVTTSVSVTQSTSGIASITDATISDVHSRQQHERKRVSVHNTVKQRHNTYV